ncbi:MAG: hypothetical protein EPN25_03140 [Nitrospirae bacterium]|nr:MAG: hypothetical protein EPN25_03140 [Nitrospirota bacterium]
MVRVVTQVLAGLMLIFGAATLLPKSYFEFKAQRTGQGIKYLVLGLLAAFFSLMAFGLAYHEALR